MRAHRLKDRVIVQAAVASRDGTGEELLTWQEHCARWAGVEPVSGKEVWSEHQQTGTQMIRVVLRYDTDTAAITPKMRVSHDGGFYDIESVINVGNRNREIHLVCLWRQLPAVFP